jgi:hypothetical protein
MQYNFTWLMQKADEALNLMTEGGRVAGELVEKYEDGKSVLSATEQVQLDAKLAELREKSAEVHSAIQSQK